MKRIHPAVRKYFSKLGKVGGARRAAVLSPERRREIASMGARAQHEKARAWRRGPGA